MWRCRTTGQTERGRRNCRSDTAFCCKRRFFPSGRSLLYGRVTYQSAAYMETMPTRKHILTRILYKMYHDKNESFVRWATHETRHIENKNKNHRILWRNPNIGRTKLRNDVRMGNVHVSFRTNCRTDGEINLLKPTDYVMHQQGNIQQLYVLPTLYLCVLYLSENKQRLVPLIS